MVLQNLKRSSEQGVINKVINAIRNYRKSVDIAFNGNINDLSCVLSGAILDNPEFFFINGFEFSGRGSKYTVIPKYMYPKGETELLLGKCYSRACSLLNRAICSNEYDTILALHDFLARNVSYCDDGMKERHSIVGPFLDKKAVCEGYAKAFKYLLDQIGIANYLVSGSAWNPTKNKDELHAWNLIRIDEKWFHVDVTFDTTIRYRNVLRYDYFCLTNSQILRDHNYAVNSYPVADTPGYDYYTKYNLVIKGKDTFQNYFLRHAMQRESDIVIKLPDDVPENGLESKVTAVLERILSESSASYTYSLNFNLKQRVFHMYVIKA